MAFTGKPVLGHDTREELIMIHEETRDAAAMLFIVC